MPTTQTELSEHIQAHLDSFDLDSAFMESYREQFEAITNLLAYSVGTLYVKPSPIFARLPVKGTLP